MNHAFRIAGDLVHATVEYHKAVRCGDAEVIRTAWRRLCNIQNQLDATCEELAVEAESPTT